MKYALQSYTYLKKNAIIKCHTKGRGEEGGGGGGAGDRERTKENCRCFNTGSKHLNKTFHGQPSRLENTSCE